MNFKQFLLREDAELSFDEGLKRIAVECKPFLSATRQPVYRGIRNPPSSNFFYTAQPTNRRPVDSTTGQAYLFNAMIDAAFGIPNIRSTSFFGSGSELNAGEYGTVHFIFPKGNFNCLWSSVINDAYVYSKTILSTIVRHGNHELSEDYLQKIFELLADKPGSAHLWINDLMGDSEEITQDVFREAILPEVYERYWTNHSAFNELTDALIKTGNELYTKNKLQRAIKSSHEIMFYDGDGYYAVSAQTVAEEFHRLTNMHTSSLGRDELYEILLDRLPST